jgi:hypothetical protein
MTRSKTQLATVCNDDLGPKLTNLRVQIELQEDCLAKAKDGKHTHQRCDATHSITQARTCAKTTGRLFRATCDLAPNSPFAQTKPPAALALVFTPRPADCVYRLSCRRIVRLADSCAPRNTWATRGVIVHVLTGWTPKRTDLCVQIELQQDRQAGRQLCAKEHKGSQRCDCASCQWPAACALDLLVNIPVPQVVDGAACTTHQLQTCAR